MEYTQILLARDGRVVTITLNRPERLNATTSVMNRELIHAFRTAGADDGIGCVVITGAGRAFCAGAEMSEFRSGIEGGPGYDAGFGPGARLDSLWNIPKPVIAAVNGAAVAVGAAIPLACDLAVASDRARIGFTFSRVGLSPEFGTTFLLPRIVGYQQALELCLSGRILDADEALRVGLVSRVFPHATFMDEVMALARQYADRPTRALAAIKESFHRNMTRSLEDAEVWESGRTGPILRAGAEHREA
ncbi:MAG: enoyl-CoA hydratase-related protein [Dehalococcoidia bacterium]